MINREFAQYTVRDIMAHLHDGKETQGSLLKVLHDSGIGSTGKVTNCCVTPVHVPTLVHVPVPTHVPVPVPTPIPVLYCNLCTISIYL